MQTLCQKLRSQRHKATAAQARRRKQAKSAAAALPTFLESGSGAGQTALLGLGKAHGAAFA